MFIALRRLHRLAQTGRKRAKNSSASSSTGLRSALESLISQHLEMPQRQHFAVD
jgi:hypothetical protein